ncbi:MAG TPA: FMN-binding glutamate synthase family protein [Candidatus Kapabacteria bacterium]|nr:FMN-binding glutamate synthase family protein [Candidatus Kapabacteria bacterium]
MRIKLGARPALAAAFVAVYLLLGILYFTHPVLLAALLLVLPLQLIYLWNIWQRKHTILRNYPIVGHFRYLFERIRPELRQYLWESDTDGAPFSRQQRSIVYQRAKDVRQTVPFGTQRDTRAVGHEWIAHTMYPVKLEERDLRVTIGCKRTRQPYSASIYNIGAMSYGALSKTAISALNGGARLEGFAHNTGEGGVSPYHLEGGDLIWQIGTGYFGCRDKNGHFQDEAFLMEARRPQIKMIELKLSQGAKPGHGGILPAAKNTPEIAAIRNVDPYVTIQSPPYHTAFRDNTTLLAFIDRMRSLAEGKPVGIKLCIGDKQEFEALAEEMLRLDLYPDFITIDGSEGGTGAAPLEFADSLGMPLHDALAFVHQTLTELGIRNEMKILAAGRIITSFDILKAVALGADACYSARGMMFALGCIQALKCDSGECPVGIATQEKSLYRGLDVADKRVRVANYHRNTMKAVIELMEACGFRSLHEVTADKLYRRAEVGRVVTLNEIYFNDQKGHISNGNFTNIALN